MILLKILLLFLFCDNFTRIEAQLNKCKTPEGNEGFCMNIWECSSRMKYIFSEVQNSVQTYNTLKSVCDYTNSTIKLCCTLLNTENSSILQEQKNINYLKTNTNCNDENSNSNSNSKSDSNTEEPITKSFDQSDNFQLNEVENHKEAMALRNKIFNENTPNEVIPINGQKLEKSAAENTNESGELTESPDINCGTNVIETNVIESNKNKENIINAQNSELFSSFNKNNEILTSLNQFMENKNSINKIQNDDHMAKKNKSKLFKISTNSDNHITNNTIIIINMRDKSTIFTNNNNSEVPVNQENKNDHLNSSTSNSDKISMELFKKILCVIFGKNYNSAAFSQNNNDKSIEISPNIFDASIETEEVSVELAAETSASAENSSSLESSSIENQTENNNSSESSSIENQTENNTSSENNVIQESFDIVNSTENTNTESQTENSTENNIEFSFSASDESDEVFNYISLPNPPHCGRNKKQNSKKGEYSWQVLLKEKNNKSTKDFCRGTLITRQHIVTTAYCVQNREIESVLIRSEKISAYITLKIEDIKVHEHFEPRRTQNDIALIKLVAPLTLEEISPICLKVDPFLTKNLTGVVAYSSGYLKSDNTLKQKAVKLISQYQCITELNDLENMLDIEENVLCAKSKASATDVCFGNEGSPLAIRGKSNGQIIYYQIGMVSEVNHCETNNRLGIFVNINPYLNWLLKHM